VPAYDVELLVPSDCELDEAGETVALTVDAEETVLGAARRAGVWLPADCQQGWCTTCAADLLSGAVDQSDARRYYDCDREAGLILTCVARPESALRLRVCQEEAMLDHRAANSLPPGSSKR